MGARRGSASAGRRIDFFFLELISLCIKRLLLGFLFCPALLSNNPLDGIFAQKHALAPQRVRLEPAALRPAPGGLLLLPLLLLLRAPPPPCKEPRGTRACEGGCGGKGNPKVGIAREARRAAAAARDGRRAHLLLRGRR